MPVTTKKKSLEQYAYAVGSVGNHYKIMLKFKAASAKTIHQKAKGILKRRCPRQS